MHQQSPHVFAATGLMSAARRLHLSFSIGRASRRVSRHESSVLLRDLMIDKVKIASNSDDGGGKSLTEDF